VAASAVLMFAGCSVAQEPSRPTPAKAPKGTSAAPEKGCLDAGNLARAILADARNGADLTVVDAKAVRSADVDGTYLVAISLDGDSKEKSVGGRAGRWTLATTASGPSTPARLR